MSNDNKIKIGFGLCFLGLFVALLSLVPAIIPDAGTLPWPILAGSIIYLPGSVLVFFSSKGETRNSNFNKIRFVRIGFVAIIAILSIRIFQA